MDPSLFLPILLVLLFIPILLSMRKQKRQMSAMQTLQSALEPGDVVMTTSGLRGTVVDASYEDTIDIEIAEGVVTTWVRAAVREKVDPASFDHGVVLDGHPTAHVEPAPAAVEAASPSVEGTAPAEEPAPAETLSLEKKSDSANGVARS